MQERMRSRFITSNEKRHKGCKSILTDSKILSGFTKKIDLLLKNDKNSKIVVPKKFLGVQILRMRALISNLA